MVYHKYPLLYLSQVNLDLIMKNSYSLCNILIPPKHLINILLKYVISFLLIPLINNKLIINLIVKLEMKNNTSSTSYENKPK